ncbi:MAG: class I SAM-dependent methyltransferase [Clostridiales bacterium]|nr:class I SAM-dependent methyltransferase [Clostridiales bacterium]
MNDTLTYYNQNAKSFIETTVSVDFHDVQDKFLSYLPPSPEILDFGCGSGRDTKYFLKAGCLVDAIDGSPELCRYATEYTGIKVKQMVFEELNEYNRYDGIWACSSILHLPKKPLFFVLTQMTAALKKKGIIYTSFKYGTFQGKRNGRYFTDMSESTFTKLVQPIREITTEEMWITSDARPDRCDEKWLNVILRKSN